MGTERPSGNCVPKNSVPINRSRGDGPRGSQIGKLKGPRMSPMKTAKTAAVWMKRRRELTLLVLSLDNLRIRKIPTSTMTTNIMTIGRAGFSVGILTLPHEVFVLGFR